jgi:hypothetical protein
MTLAALRAEIDNDPKSLGYAALKVQTNGPEAVAARMNEAGASVPPETLFKAYVPTEEILAEMVWSEFTGWSAAVKTGLDMYLRGARVKTGSATLRASLAAMIPAGTSKTNMIAAASRNASRAEALWGENFSVTSTDVANALALP